MRKRSLLLRSTLHPFVKYKYFLLDIIIIQIMSDVDVEKKSLISRLKEKSPVPIWVFVIVFGPVLPIAVLFVYCIDWYYQVHIIPIINFIIKTILISGFTP